MILRTATREAGFEGTAQAILVVDRSMGEMKGFTLKAASSASRLSSSDCTDEPSSISILAEARVFAPMNPLARESSAHVDIGPAARVGGWWMCVSAIIDRSENRIILSAMDSRTRAQMRRKAEGSLASHWAASNARTLVRQ